MRIRRADLPPSEPTIHSGVLFKRGYGRRWKPRHFVLTASTLRCFTFENGRLRDEIDLTQCTPVSLEIMPSDALKTGRSKSTIWRLGLNVPKRSRLLVAAPTEREMNTWIQQLSMVLGPVDSNQRERQSEPSMVRRMSLPDDWCNQEPELAANWKEKTTDFANFVARPRRSVIFRRYSFESKPLVPGVYRHSTGQISDDPSLQQDLEELRRRGIADGLANDDEEMDSEEEEALLRALRAFSLVCSEGSESHLSPLIPDNEDEQKEADDDPVPAPRSRPILHYKKPESLDATHHVTPRPRRYSTGCTVEWDQWSSTPLQLDELASEGPDDSSPSSGSQSSSVLRSSDAQTTTASTATSLHSPTMSGIPTTAEATAEGADSDQSKPRRRWFKRLASKWRALREDRAAFCTAENPGLDSTSHDCDAADLTRLSDELMCLVRQPSKDNVVEDTVLQVLNEMVREVSDAVGRQSPGATSDHATPSRNEQSSDRDPSPSSHLDGFHATQDSPMKKQNILRRWHDKLTRGSNSRRLSTGDLMPDVTAEQNVATSTDPSPKPSSDDITTSEAVKFRTRLRRGNTDPKQLIELKPIEDTTSDDHGQMKSDVGGEEEIVVVVVRRPGSETGPAPLKGSRKVTYRVYLDVSDTENQHSDVVSPPEVEVRRPRTLVRAA